MRAAKQILFRDTNFLLDCAHNPDVFIRTGMRGAQDGDLLSAKVKMLLPVGFDEWERLEWFC
jgi:hypothetical protein